MKTLKELFLEELADMYDAEHRIIKALPVMARAATCSHLKKALLSHSKETEGHLAKIEQIFQSFGEEAKGQACEATIGILKEGDQLAAEYKGSPAVDAALIASAQKVEHYEMASYGCLREWAEILGHESDAGLLQDILDEERAANKSLTQISLEKNRDALGKSDEMALASKAAAEKRANPTRNIGPTKSNRKGAVVLAV